MPFIDYWPVSAAIVASPLHVHPTDSDRPRTASDRWHGKGIRLSAKIASWSFPARYSCSRSLPLFLAVYFAMPWAAGEERGPCRRSRFCSTPGASRCTCGSWWPPSASTGCSPSSSASAAGARRRRSGSGSWRRWRPTCSCSGSTSTRSLLAENVNRAHRRGVHPPS